MKKYFKIGLVAIMLFTLSGCNSNTPSHTLSNAIDKALIATSGNKPPQFFAFSSSYRANGYVMQHKDYSFTMPLTKERDWSKMSGWNGAYIYGGIGIGMDNPDNKKIGNLLGYAINISSRVGEYGKMQRAIENKDLRYIFTHRKVTNKDKLRIEYHGKENYTCEVSEFIRRQGSGIRFNVYDCYKFNPSHTKYKSVNIKLLYTKSPNLPAKYKILAKEYTYKDLKSRAKRMLDSLYIKDEW
ncbi:hypothetical protein [Sulfurovum sp. TSL1]|uniref:hypothetical protein n=1 Tax=Sulfurovum sp. TSL1 TaxID=2826994 RepID=UPI001CC4888E|nr:hypothetical protein [Sulfurovum sp. TSL1]GIT98146.1 hypothetical protein TSL1_09670 [Sulfurovum sp. TSL1]